MTESSSRSVRIAVVGDALIDELHDTAGSREFVGGAGLNVAVGLALLGSDVTLVATIGEDEPGDRIRQHLSDHGVRLVESISPHGTSRAISNRTEAGEPRYRFNDAAQQRRIGFDARTLQTLDDADLVVVSCFPFDNTDQVAELLAAVDQSEKRLVIDPNPRAGMLRDRDAFLTSFEEAAGQALLVKVGDEDAELLIGAPLDTLVTRLRPAGPGGPTVLATAGRAGAGVFHQGHAVSSGIVELDGPVIDTMGAGDATLASVVHRISLDGVPADSAGWAEVLAEAMTIAAATVRQHGALLRRPEAPPLLRH